MTVEEYEQIFNEIKLAKNMQASIRNAWNKCDKLSPAVLPGDPHLDIDESFRRLDGQMDEIRNRIKARFPGGSSRSPEGKELFHLMVSRNARID